MHADIIMSYQDNKMLYDDGKLLLTLYSYIIMTFLDVNVSRYHYNIRMWQLITRYVIVMEGCCIIM